MKPSTGVLAALVLSMLALGAAAQSVDEAGDAGDVVEIRLVTDNAHGAYYFQPAGVYVEPGQTVRFISVQYLHTVTAYHPDNGNPRARIPDGAESFDVLLGDGAQDARESVDIRFDRPGTYDYYCRLHESHGQVGRIVVGRPGKPVADKESWPDAPAQPEGYVGLSVHSTRLPSVQRLFDYLDPARIVEEEMLHFPVEELKKFGNAYHEPNEPVP